MAENISTENKDELPPLLEELGAALLLQNETLLINSTMNITTKVVVEPAGVLYTSVVSSVLGSLIMGTIVGNVFVIAAILLEKNLQQIANYLIVSLAVADLLVACLVMPLGAVYVISRDWILGPELCDMWTSSDVLCCTASILHLVAIATDRYWAVTDANYVNQRDIKKVAGMIATVWIIALIVSLAPQLGWKDPDYIKRIEQHKCLVSQDVSYQVFATLSTFYVPLVVILILYWRIFQAARSRIRRGRDNFPGAGADADVEAGTGGNRLRQMFRRGGRSGERETAFTIGDGSATDTDEDVEAGRRRPLAAYDPVRAQRAKIESLQAKREKKAAKTLAIITGAFVICWLPFFLTALLTPFFGPVSDNFSNFILWLGYFNSTLNPLIYTIFSPDFRAAFRRILFGRRNRNR